MRTPSEQQQQCECGESRSYTLAYSFREFPSAPHPCSSVPVRVIPGGGLLTGATIQARGGGSARSTTLHLAGRHRATTYSSILRVRNWTSQRHVSRARGTPGQGSAR
eukprot:5115584-Prymnesium_polylepis.2